MNKFTTIAMHSAIALSLLSPFSIAQADDQTTSSPTLPQDLVFGGFADTYFAHDFNDPNVRNRPYTTQPVTDNELRLNLGYIDAKLQNDNYRGRLAIQYGDSVRANYASEDDRFWRYFQEATAGVKLSDTVWFDAGIYLSHLGLETFNSSDNMTYTRSLVADFSPYYETGAKLTYQRNDTYGMQVHVLRGWQNISQSQDPALGLQFNYTPTKQTQLTYANFLGNQHGFRNFHDFIAKTDVTDQLTVGAEFDVGNQNQSLDRGNVWWYGWTAMARYKLTSRVSIAGRVEMFDDPHQVVLQTLDDRHFNATGLSANIDYEFAKNMFWRTEYRVMLGNSPVFPGVGSEFHGNDAVIVTSLSYLFNLGGLF